ncbi:MAG: sugar ABC transporter permease [Nitriliruptoraceae bacterium]
MVGDRGWRKAGIILLFILPSFLPLLVFRLLPMVASVGISGLEWNLISAPSWVGLDNYTGVLTDPAFHRGLRNTLYYIAGYLPLVYLGALSVALLLNRGVRAIAFFRGLYFLPVLTSWVVVALLWKWILNPQVGIVNYALSLIGVAGPGWWTDPAWAMPSIILASAWKDLGFIMLILLAGLQGISEEMYEAARVDGASAWQRFRHVTMPLLTPATFFVAVLALIGGFQVFDQVWVMTEGGPAGATTVVMEQIYSSAFRYGLMGRAAAMSWVLFAIILGATLLQFRHQRRWVHYAE